MLGRQDRVVRTDPWSHPNGCRGQGTCMNGVRRPWPHCGDLEKMKPSPGLEGDWALLRVQGARTTPLAL